MEKVQCKRCHHDNSINAKYCSGCGYSLPLHMTDEIDIKVAELENRSRIDKKKIFGIVVGVLMFGLSYFAVQQLFFKPPSYDRVLMQVASELNKTCPIMVDEYTRLDNTIALPDNVFQYNYTLVNITKTEVNLDTVRKYIEPSIVNNVKTNPDLKFFRDNKTTMTYYYKDKNSEFVHKFSITPDQYENE